MVSLCAKLSYMLGYMYVVIESIGCGCRHTGLFPGLVPLELGVGVDSIMAATVDRFNQMGWCHRGGWCWYAATVDSTREDSFIWAGVAFVDAGCYWLF